MYTVSAGNHVFVPLYIGITNIRREPITISEEEERKIKMKIRIREIKYE